MGSYRDLEIYQLSKRLALTTHELTMHLPKHELYEEGSQVRRSSKAVTSLIVEGFGRRRYKQDYVRYLVCAHSECDETIVHLEFLMETKSSKDEVSVKALISEYQILSKKINTYIKWIERNA